jgi:hypothetical protein
MRLNSCILFILLGCTSLAKGQGVYDALKIPAELLKNADAVVRNEEYNLNIKSRSNATMSYKMAVTILSKSGDNHAGMDEYYDRLSSVYNLKACLYDAKGDKIKSYKPSDFKDESLTSEGTMYDDNRIKKLQFLNTSYPYTVEYSYEKDYNGYLGFEPWRPVSYFSCAVEKSAFTLQIAKDVTFKYLKSTGMKTDSSEVNNKLVYKWSCQNLPAFEYEPLAAGLSDITPWVMLSPNKFEYDHSQGNVDSWKNLGTWIFESSNQVQSLPESTKATVKSLTENAKTDQEKIAILYRYLQSNTRYVSVQLGIGGYIPITADKVAAVNYGDCKALSNYMRSLLSVAGIASNLVMLGSDMPSLNPTYSSFGQANHMVLCVPAAKDTTWLECTSQYMPVGFLGKSTASKIVLLVTKDGGKLVNTPTYKPEDNFQNRFTTVSLSAEGNADINIRTDYGSCQYQDNLGMMLIEPTDQRKRLMNSLDIPNMEIISASFLQPDKAIPKLEERLVLRGSQLLSLGGDKMFLTLNMLNRKESVPRKIENRKTSFSLPYGFKDMDEITYTIPKGYKAEFIPKDVLLESEFGKYTAKAILKDNTIVYTRTQLINSKKYPPEKYKDLVDFYKKIYLADKEKAVLAKID